MDRRHEVVLEREDGEDRGEQARSESAEPGTEQDSADEERDGGCVEIEIQPAADDQHGTNGQSRHPIVGDHGLFAPLAHDSLKKPFGNGIV